MRAAREIFGAEIQFFRLDPQYWETIIEHFKDAGLRCVTTYVQWSTHAVGAPDAKNPAGVMDFTGRTNPRLNLLRFIELVEKHGLNLNFRCGPFCCNEMIYGAYPSWLVMGDPGLMVWDYQNRTTPGYWIGKKEGSQPSYLHPEYLRHCENWFAAVDPIIVQHLKSRGGCITMLNLDNEISYIVRDSFLESDYNPVNVQPGGFWHQFLAEKYGAADQLPYDTRYAHLDSVPPPRAVPETITRDLAWYVDWVEFKTWVMSRYIERLREMHQRLGVTDLTWMTNFNPHRPEGIPTRMPDFEAAASAKGQVDGIVGYDFYRGVFMSYSGYQSMARVLKLMNASLNYTWSAEFMSGTWQKVMEVRVSDDHMRFMARCALAHGCKAIGWYMFHDRDCWGDAPVSSHGHRRRTHHVLRETIDLLFGKIKGWDELVPQTDVAIIYDLIQHQHDAIGDPSPCDDNNLHIGKPLLAGVPAGKACAEYEGLFRVVEQAGVQPGVVDIMHDAKRLSAFPLAFLPGSPVIERKALAALQHYVAGGGKLVVTGPVPTLDERCQPLTFLPAAQFIHLPDYVGQEQPEQEDLAKTKQVADLIAQHGGKPHVLLQMPEAVEWIDWQEGGGHRPYRQPRMLASASLHRAPSGERVLFVLNHFPEAARLTVSFPRDAVTRLVDLDSAAVIPSSSGSFALDLDRKSCAVYRVE